MAIRAEEVQALYDKARINPPKWLKPARENRKVLAALFYGEKFKDLLSKIEHIEQSDDRWKAREKYSHSIVDLNERILLPLENVYSATGGSKRYDGVTSEAQKKILHNKLSNVRGNNTLERWLQDNWMQSYYVDPNGLIMMEWDGDEINPTYKSINDIMDYKANGQNVDYVLFEPEVVKLPNNTQIKKVRYIDSENDFMFKLEGSTLTLIEDESFKVPFSSCPAIVNSNIIKLGTQFRLSPAQNIIELEKEYLRDRSILNIVKMLNGFQNLIRPGLLCTDCAGTGKKGDSVCSTCSGTGELMKRDATGEIVVPIDTNNPEQKLPDVSKIATWFGLDSETWDKYRDEIKVLEMLCFETLWGTHYTNQDDVTATAKLLDTQPTINKLYVLSNTAEWVEWQISEWYAEYITGNIDGKAKTAINYGKRFILDSPDALLQSYKDAKKDEVNITVLDNLLNQYLTAKFKSDPTNLLTELIKAAIEPYIHYTVEQVSSIFGQKEAQKKMKFGEWYEKLSFDEQIKDKELLKKEYESWFNSLSLTINSNTNE